LFTPAGQYVRRFVDTAQELTDAPFMSVEILDNGDAKRRELLYHVGVCRMQDGTRCFFVCLPVADRRSIGQFVLLPGLWAQDIAAYEQMVMNGDRWLHADYSTIDGAPWERLIAPEYANRLHLLWHGWLHHNIDMTKIMYAIRDKVGDNTVRKVDAAEIGSRFGVRGAYLDECLGSLSARGFLQRAPKRKRPHLVKLTQKAIQGF